MLSATSSKKNQLFSNRFQPFSFSSVFIIKPPKLRKTFYNQSDQVLVDKCLSGDAQAQQELYEKYVQAMYNVSVRMVNNSEDASDIIQEVFVKVFRNLTSFQGESTLGAWIKKITVNTTLNFLRKAKKNTTSSWEEGMDMPMEEEIDAARFSMEQIHQAIKQLPERCRIVLSLYLIEGYQHQEIASILNITVSTSKTQYRRGRQLLQNILKE